MVKTWDDTPGIDAKRKSGVTGSLILVGSTSIGRSMRGSVDHGSSAVRLDTP